MPKKKKVDESEKDKSGKISTGNNGSPSSVVSKVESATPIVSDKPKTPLDKDNENDTTKKTRRTKKVVEAEQAQAKLEADRLIASTIVDMKSAFMTKIAGDVWKPEPPEREALIAAYQCALAQFPVLPWYVGLAIAEGAYLGPRLILMSLEKSKAAKQAKEKNTIGEGAVSAEQTNREITTPSGQLDPVT